MNKTTLTLGGVEVDLLAVTSMPPGVVLYGSAVMVNCGCWSPPWVNELVKTNAGCKLLRRILRGLIAREARDELCKEIEEGVADFKRWQG